MAERAGGRGGAVAGRWRRDIEGAALRNLFRSGAVDPQRQDATYTETVYRQHLQHFGRITDVRNFRNNYRKVAAQWITEQAQHGIRRAELGAEEEAEEADTGNLEGANPEVGRELIQPVALPIQ